MCNRDRKYESNNFFVIKEKKRGNSPMKIKENNSEKKSKLLPKKKIKIKKMKPLKIKEEYGLSFSETMKLHN